MSFNLLSITLQESAYYSKDCRARGTLVSIGVDLELSQVLAAGLSFAPTNEPEFSKIPIDVSNEVLVTYFVRACLVHVKRYEFNLVFSDPVLNTLHSNF